MRVTAAISGQQAPGFPCRGDFRHSTACPWVINLPPHPTLGFSRHVLMTRHVFAHIKMTRHRNSTSVHLRTARPSRGTRLYAESHITRIAKQDSLNSMGVSHMATREKGKVGRPLRHVTVAQKKAANASAAREYRLRQKAQRQEWRDESKYPRSRIIDLTATAPRWRTESSS